MRALALAISWLGAFAALAGAVPPAMQCPAPPQYPAAERAARRSGSVLLHVSVSPAGEITDVSIVRPLSPAFDDAAEQALRRCSFTGATRDGVPVPAVLELTIQFAPPVDTARIEGLVVGSKGEPIAGATVSGGGASAVTDARGAFSLQLELADEETVMVTVFRKGIAAQIFEERMVPGVTRSAHYAIVDHSLSYTIIGDDLLPAAPAPDRTPAVSHYLLGKADIDRAPGSMEDIARAIATLPGVVADPDLLATFVVRGGAPEETIDYLDGVPLSNPFHLGGFASVYNPMLIESADFSAGVTPARYQSSLSGALDVRYASGESKELHLEADLSMQTAKIRVQAPTGIEGLSVMGAFRRSFFEVYFGALRAAHVISDDYVAPEIGEYFGRLFYRRGNHRLTLSYLRATDGFSFLLKPGEKPLFGSASGIEFSNLLQLGLLSDRVAIGDAELTLTAAVTNDASNTSISSQTVYARDVAQQEALVRADLSVPFSGGHRLLSGIQLARRSYDFHGQVPDARGVAPWASFPLLDSGQANLDIGGQVPLREAAIYAELLARPAPFVAVEAGARVQAVTQSRSPVYTARAAAALDLPGRGVLKLEAGVATQQTSNVLMLDPGYGNRDLLPERSRQLVLGIEQPLPFQALLRLEGFAKWLDRLAVNPDGDAGVRALLSRGEPVFQSAGTGTARGVDLLLLGRATKFSWGLSSSLIFSERVNPLAAGRSRYPTPFDQRFGFAGNVSVIPADRWLLSLRASFHTGRPYTPVIGFTRDEPGHRYRPVFGDTNSERYAGFFEASARVERQFRFAGFKMAWYAEVLNLTNATNIFSLTYDSGDFARGATPGQGSFNHLPIRPFLGIRGEN